MATYTDRGEAVYREIEEVLGKCANEFDIEAIADEVLGDFEDGFTLKVDAQRFWEIVEEHAL